MKRFLNINIAQSLDREARMQKQKPSEPEHEVDMSMRDRNNK